MPRSEEAEREVIAALLVDPGCIDEVSAILKYDDFYVRQHQYIFTGIIEVNQKDGTVDLITLAAHLNSKWKQIIKTGVISRITDCSGSASNVLHYCKIVSEQADVRRLIEASEYISSKGYDGTYATVKDYVGWSEDVFHNAIAERSNPSTITIAEGIEKLLEKIQCTMENDGESSDTETGYEALDKHLTTLRPGRLILLGGRPGMAKSSFSCNVALNIAKKGGGVFIASLEEEWDQIVLRLISTEAGVGYTKMDRGFVTSEEWADILYASEILRKLPIIIDATPAMTPAVLTSRARRFKSQLNRQGEELELIVFDHIQIGEPDKGASDMREVVTKISKGLKAVAKKLNVPVLAISQLSRRCEERDNKKPRLSDLRESGALEQDADAVIFLYRENYYNADADPSVGEMRIAKQRGGSTTRWLKMRFDLATMTWSDS